MFHPRIPRRKFSPFFRMSCRSAAEHVLDNSTRAMTAGEIAAIVLRMGWQPSAFTPPSGLMAASIHTAIRQGNTRIVALGDGYFLTNMR